MSNFIKFRDNVEFNRVEIIKPVDSIQDFAGYVETKNTVTPLMVKIAASHAGLITRNNGFYQPDKMRIGIKSFTDNYNKPLQVHHDQEADPIGRIVAAEYIDTSPSAKTELFTRDMFKNVHNQKYFEAFLDGELSFIQSINFICDNLAKSDILTDPNYQGLGYAKLTALVTDPEAIQKVKDGRFLTGSVGVSTDKAVCSVCKEDWAAGDQCDHRPGKMYDGAKAFLITGNLTYDEYSFVNVPADRHSRVIEMNVNGITDSFSLDSEVSDNVDLNKIGSTIITDSVQLEENHLMEIKEVIAKLVASFKDKYAILGDEYFTKDFVLDPTIVIESEIALLLEAQMDKDAVTKIHSLEGDSIAPALLVIRPTLSKEVIDAALSEKPDTETLYTKLNDAEWDAYSETEDEAVIAKQSPETKLSASARKRLPGSSFCGPNRSFPVSDATHIDVARELVLVATLSAPVKNRILANLNRKAKAFGETIVEDKKVETVIPEVKCETCDGLKTELDSVRVEFEKLQVNNASFTDTLNKLTSELNAVREELKLALEDTIQMADQLVTSNESLTKVNAQRVLDYKLLSGEKIEDTAVELEGLYVLNDAALSDEFTKWSTKVDMKKITDNINTGLTRQPTGTITDPTLNLEDSKQKQMPTKQNLEKIATEYNRILLGGNSVYGRGNIAAEKYRKDMKDKGFLPSL